MQRTIKGMRTNARDTNIGRTRSPFNNSMYIESMRSVRRTDYRDLVPECSLWSRVRGTKDGIPRKVSDIPYKNSALIVRAISARTNERYRGCIDIY